MIKQTALAGMRGCCFYRVIWRGKENICPELSRCASKEGVLADDEVKNRTVTVRSRKEGELPAMPVADAIAKLKEEIDTKAK